MYVIYILHIYNNICNYMMIINIGKNRIKVSFLLTSCWREYGSESEKFHFNLWTYSFEQMLA